MKKNHRNLTALLREPVSKAFSDMVIEEDLTKDLLPAEQIEDDLNTDSESYRAAVEQYFKALPSLINVAGRPEFGDYQVNSVMTIAGRVKKPARELAADIQARLQLQDLAEEVTVAGPGFLNIRLKNDVLCDYLEQQFPALLSGEMKADTCERIVIDLSSPNLAKEMHVGHLRSAVIGDAVARIFEHLGHEVIRQNHVGDWGTQFGMLIAYMQELGAEANVKLSDLEQFYQAARHQFDTDADFAERARTTVVALQSGDVACLDLWRQFTRRSLEHCQALYKRLGVALKSSDVRGESAYNDQLPEVIESAHKAGALSQSDGAGCIFLDEIRGKDDKPLPLIVQKSDGGYLYATTDLAAIRYRAEELAADRVLYFADARQALHFRQVLAAAVRIGFVRDDMVLQHLPFGMITAEDGKPIRTRDGGTLKLNDLLDEGEQRALALVKENNPKLSEDEHLEIAKAVSVAAIKYADLHRSPINDYHFNWDTMLSFEGKTGPYLQYAYARIVSIFRRAGLSFQERQPPLRMINEPSERALALHLSRFSEALEEVTDKYQPHILCAYLYELASRFSSFYEQCPVLQAEQDVQDSRLRLCQLTGETLRVGLSLLGIEAISRM